MILLNLVSECRKSSIFDYALGLKIGIIDSNGWLFSHSVRAATVAEFAWASVLAAFKLAKWVSFSRRNGNVCCCECASQIRTHVMDERGLLWIFTARIVHCANARTPNQSRHCVIYVLCGQIHSSATHLIIIVWAGCKINSSQVLWLNHEWELSELSNSKGNRFQRKLHRLAARFINTTKTFTSFWCSVKRIQ